MTPKLNFQQDKKQRTNLYASDCGKLEADIWLELKGTEPTNPPEWTDTLKWSAGKGVETAMVKVLIENGIIDDKYNQDELPSTKIEREGVLISMKFDALTKKSILKFSDITTPNEIEIGEGEPLEIKSINNANHFDVQKYIDGYPRENYVGQLAIYMDALGKDKGYLFACTIDGLNPFFFVCNKIGERKYQCGNTVVDLNDIYKKFALIWKKFKDGVEPNWTEQVYKLPIETIDWTKLSTTAIGNARTNKKVIGSEESWKLLYSPFSKLILEKQGIKARGYTEEELKLINEKTAGYTSKKKK